MNKALFSVIAVLVISSTLFSCKKPFKCICAGGVVFEETEKEVRAVNSKKAKAICEANNQPPTSPDVVNCGLE